MHGTACLKEGISRETNSSLNPDGMILIPAETKYEIVPL
jgi:hypothetical protein